MVNLVLCLLTIVPIERTNKDTSVHTTVDCVEINFVYSFNGDLWAKYWIGLDLSMVYEQDVLVDFISDVPDKNYVVGSIYYDQQYKRYKIVLSSTFPYSDGNTLITIYTKSIYENHTQYVRVNEDFDLFMRRGFSGRRLFDLMFKCFYESAAKGQFYYTPYFFQSYQNFSFDFSQGE